MVGVLVDCSFDGLRLVFNAMAAAVWGRDMTLCKGALEVVVVVVVVVLSGGAVTSCPPLALAVVVIPAIEDDGSSASMTTEVSGTAIVCGGPPGAIAPAFALDASEEEPCLLIEEVVGACEMVVDGAEEVWRGAANI